jgi:hypothetical protein
VQKKKKKQDIFANCWLSHRYWFLFSVGREKKKERKEVSKEAVSVQQK